MEVQQLQGVEHVGGLEAFDQVEHLARREAELGLVAAAVLPLAGAQRGQAQAHAQARLHVQGLGFLDDHRQLAGLLDDDEGFQAQLAADQGQADELTVLVAIADDQAARAGQAQHGHQLGLGAGLEAKAFTTGRGQLAGDAAVLVHLDRVHGGVAALVVEFLHRAAEGGLQLAQAVAQDVGEPQQQRQLQAGVGGLGHDLGQGQLGAAGAARAHDHAALAVHVEVALAPVGNGVGVAGAVEGPGGHGRGFRGKGGDVVYRPGVVGSCAGVTMRPHVQLPRKPR